MNRRTMFLTVASAIFLAACGEETRTGQLTLAGSAPVRIASQDGKTVEFFAGPLKVEFGASSGRKFTVKLEQDGRTATFSGKVPNADNWNFTVLGKDVGQPMDFSSRRNIQLYGAVSKSWGTGGSCGFNGRWETEDSWQKGNEDWSVAFADAATSHAVGSFNSRQEGQNYLIDSRNVWCRERPDHDRGGRWDRMSKKLEDIKPADIKFD